MNALNGLLTSVFDLVLAPFERVGPRTALVAASAVFGIAALFAFKHLSAQRAIQAAKDRIKGHLIEIRIYQDDLGLVSRSIGKILLRNLQYLGLNLGPFVPLSIPFALVAAQLVVRYAYAPSPVFPEDARPLAGQGTLIEVELAPGRGQEIAGLRVVLPEGVRAVSPLVRAPAQGRAWQEVIAVAAGEHRVAFELSGGAREEKRFVAGGAHPGAMQPRRVSSRDWLRAIDPERWPLLWPAEESFSPSSPFRVIALDYPARDLGWMPKGEGGVILVFVLASLLFGLLALKPLRVQI